MRIHNFNGQEVLLNEYEHQEYQAMVQSIDYGYLDDPHYADGTDNNPNFDVIERMIADGVI